MDKRRINISALLTETMSMQDFELKNRFTEEEFKILPDDDLSQIYPLNSLGETKLYDLIHRLGIRKGYQLNEKYFTSIIELNMKAVSDAEIKHWFDELKIKSDENVVLVWDSFGAVITKWSIFKKYYDDFFYPVSDDLTILDESLNWSLYIFHEEIMYYGRNDDIFISKTIKLPIKEGPHEVE